MHTPPLELPTLDQKPSWTNRAGRVDRSACFVLRCSTLWRDAEYQPAARVVRGLETRGRITLIADHLAHLVRTRQPRTLRGDRRTQKSNALTQARLPRPPLHLPDDWSQTFTIERWRLHANLAQHFFACPRCGERALMLFLPQCTEAEQRDAHFAAAYLRLYQNDLIRHSQFEIRDSLLRRYAPLLPPRPLLCRKCLGVRYGDVPAQRAASKAQQAQLDRVLLTDDQRRALRVQDHCRVMLQRRVRQYAQLKRLIKAALPDGVTISNPPGGTGG